MPDSAAERKGVQPVVHVEVNGGDRAEVALGEAVPFKARIEVPPAPGRVVSATWDFEGIGTYRDAVGLGDPTSETIWVDATHAFTNPGTYFPAIRVPSQREGDPSDPIRSIAEPLPGTSRRQGMRGSPPAAFPHPEHLLLVSHPQCAREKSHIQA
jgi:hypothetical protein